MNALLNGDLNRGINFALPGKLMEELILKTKNEMLAWFTNKASYGVKESAKAWYQKRTLFSRANIIFQKHEEVKNHKFTLMTSSILQSLKKGTRN